VAYVSARPGARQTGRANYNAPMPSTSPWLWLLRGITGYRLRHLLGVGLVLATILLRVTLPFWWLGEVADSAVGIPGVLLVVAAYLSVTAIVLAFSAVLLGRLILTRLRRRAELLGFGTGAWGSGVRISF